MFATLSALLDLLGTAAFAATGALVASRQRMDITGFALLAVVTGVGGGTLRDLLLGATPVAWVQDPAPVLLCLAVAVAGFFLAHHLQSRYRAVLWCDAAGLALFSVTGAEVALGAGAGPVVACAMGVVTASFGGMIRDVLGGESPLILRQEIYVSAALLGAAGFVGLSTAGMGREAAVGLAALAAFALRGVALSRGWSLPRYRPRAAVDGPRPDG